MKQFAIYTACIGGYDNIVQPEVIDERFDYILFTDDVKEQRIGVWQVRPVVYTHTDKTRIARYVKTHPHELLPQYKATLWMDSSIQIVSHKVYARFVELFNANIDIASVKHPKRDCIFDEAYEVASRKQPGALEYDNVALVWCHALWKEHYPRHNGLYETGILFRRNNEVVQKADELWWNCINAYSKRDQLSFNYVLWKIKPLVGEYLSDGEHVMNSDKIHYAGHSAISARKALSLTRLQLIRYKFRVRNKENAHAQWYSLLAKRNPVLWLYTWGTFTAICDIIGFKFKKYVKITQTKN